MASKNLPKQKLNTFAQPRMLTPSELESLKQNMWAAARWMKEQPLPKTRKRYKLPN